MSWEVGESRHYLVLMNIFILPLLLIKIVVIACKRDLATLRRKNPLAQAVAGANLGLAFRNTEQD